MALKTRFAISGLLIPFITFITAIPAIPALANPANKMAFVKHFDRYLPAPLNTCAVCHVGGKPGGLPQSLKEFPHNRFGDRLRILGEEWRKAGKRADITARIEAVAREDSDSDGVDNLSEILLGHLPGDPKDRPTAAELKRAPQLKAEFGRFLASYRWRPFEPVVRPAVPRVAADGLHRLSYPLNNRGGGGVSNAIDAFIAAEHARRGLKARPPASKQVLLRRVYIDLIGLNPTPPEMAAFDNDRSPSAYEKVVDRLLNDPRYGERWGRHWMDVWRYSDWAGWSDGGQIRDSKPHIWRWRDWIVESLNKDKPYDRMVQEMLAADEIAPDDLDTLRATGFLARNFKLLSREQWMEDTLNHTSKAFLGLTMHCAKCHNHQYDPITQDDYYHLRAIFEPHNVRTLRLAGQPDINKDGLVEAFDADPKVATYFYPRGDERHPDKSKAYEPGIPVAFGGDYHARPVKLTRLAVHPDRRDYVVKESAEAVHQAFAEARAARDKVFGDSSSSELQRKTADARVEAARLAVASLMEVLNAEALEDQGRKDSPEWKQAAMQASKLQTQQAAADATLAVLLAQQEVQKAESAKSGKNGEAAVDAMKKKLAEAEKSQKSALAKLVAPPTTAYTPRSPESYPDESTGRRLALARWITDRKNPLCARVAVNHIWARHFGAGIVPSTEDFGRNGRPPSNPQLLDWLAAELMNPTVGSASPWSMKHIHRLIVTSNAYRMSSTPDSRDAALDPDNVYVWRMTSRRLEAESVRDNVLYASGRLDRAMGGPDIDNKQGLTSLRRSIYLRHAAEKQVEFLQIFDGPSVTECYMRKPSVMPQQALALANSEIAIREARLLARSMTAKDSASFIQDCFLRVLCRKPTAQESKMCMDFLASEAKQLQAHPIAAESACKDPKDGAKPSLDASLHARENLVLVLFNHNDFVTVR